MKTGSGLTIIRTDPESSRLCEMTRTLYDDIDVPFEKRNFGNLGIYIRRTAR
jgi:hypothetical protein